MPVNISVLFGKWMYLADALASFEEDLVAIAAAGDGTTTPLIVHVDAVDQSNAVHCRWSVEGAYEQYDRS